MALRMARRMTTSVASEDMVAAGMLGLTEAASRYDDREPFLPFAELRIRGAILDEIRRVQGRARGPKAPPPRIEVAALGDAATDAVAMGPTPAEVASALQSLSRVRGGLFALEPRDVALLRLHFLEEQTFQEIAVTLAITPSRACQLLWRAVDRLRSQLGVRVTPDPTTASKAA